MISDAEKRFYAFLTALVVGSSLSAAPAAAQSTGFSPNLSEACPGNRYIGLDPTPQSRCPQPSRSSGWQARKLFPGASRLAPELRAYCVYDWTRPGAPNPAGLPTAGNPTATDWLDAECGVVSPLSHPYADVNAALNEAAFRAQVDVPNNLPVGVRPSRVIVVDTAVDGGFPRGGHGVSDHGQAMAMIVRSLSCSPGSGWCAAEVATQLAMPLITQAPGIHQVDRASGGFFGRPSDVASAIHNGLHRATANGNLAGTIVNLSVGWTRDWGGDTGGNWTSLPPSIASVYSAIVEARCRGALVIAAAGNDPGGPAIIPGATFPAGWETEQAPDTARCARVGGGPFGRTGSSPYRPLVYAVSGVDGRDRPLANEQAASRPRLVAPAGHVAVSYPPSYVSGTYTGSSVAAAAASAVAAVVWSYRPGMSGAEVMDLVQQAGVNLGLPVDTCLGGSCSATAHRLSMCHSIAQACIAGGTRSPPPCLAKLAGRDLTAVGHNFTVPAPLQRIVQGTTKQWPPAPCENPVFASNLSQIAYPCPNLQVASGYRVPYAAPQPIDPGSCPNCGVVVSQNLLTLGISYELDNSVLLNPMLRVQYFSGEEILYAIKDIPELYAGDEYQIVMDDLDTQDISSANIEFVTDTGVLVSDPLIIEY